MAADSDPMKQIPPEHQNIVQSTWSQLLGSEGNVQNLAMDLFKSLVTTQLGKGQSVGDQAGGAGGDGANQGSVQGGGGGGGAGSNDLFQQLGGLAGQFLGTRGGNAGGSQPTEGVSDGSHASGGGNSDLFQQLGGLAGQFMKGQGQSPQSQPQSGNTDGGESGGPAGGGGGNLMSTLGGLGNLAKQFGGGSGGGGGNLMSMIGSLGGLAALANGLHDPGSLLSFFKKTPVAQDAANPENSSRDIYKIIKGVIFNLLGSKLPAESFSQNTEAKGAWKGYLGVIANALRNFA